MNIKSLLLGSAAVVVAATGARAADAIVIAEPEPMEYVRVCDMYGAGFFYIPGTETCLKIGGYMRYEMHYNNESWAVVNDAGDVIDSGDHRFGKFARFQLNMDARNETEWGTLRSYAEARFNWNSTGGLIGGGAGTVLNQGFIELQQANGTIRLGKSDTPYARFLGYGTPFGPFDGSYGFNNTGELSYTFNGANGFSAIVGVIESGSGEFEPAVEGGVNFEQGWGNIGAMVAYDTEYEEWGAKLGANFNFGMFTLGGQVYYASGYTPIYAIGSSYWGDTESEFSAVVYAKAAVTETLGVAAAFQWFDHEYAANPLIDDGYEVTAGLDWTPINGLRIMPEVQYNKVNYVGGGDQDVWRTAIRFQRSF